MRNFGSRTYLRQTPIPKMPPGLIDLMEGMAKEVLKKNPTDIYEFCAAHMRRLLEIRDGTAQEQSMSLKIELPTTQKQQEVCPEKCSDTCMEKIILEDNYDLKENLISEEEFKSSTVSNLRQNFVKVPVRHEMDLMEASEIEIAQEFVNSQKNGKCIPAEFIENDNAVTADEINSKTENADFQYLEPANYFETEERYPTHFNDTINVNTTSLVESKSTTVKETEIFEVNQSNLTNDYVATMVEENIQTSVTNKIDNNINNNNDIAEAEDCTKSPISPKIIDDTLKITSEEHISFNANKLTSIIEHDNHVTSIDEVQKGEQNQITPTLDNAPKEAKICEVKVTSEENEFNHDDNYLVESENCSQSNITEEVDDCIFHDVNTPEAEVTLKADEHIISVVENVAHVDIDTNNYNNDNEDSTNENGDTSTFNNVKDLEELDIDNNTEDTFSENENSNNLQVTRDHKSNKDLLTTSQNIKEADIDKQTIQKENDVTPTYLNEISSNHGELETNIVIDNSGNTCRTGNDTNNMDLETAAITIQKVFRSFLYKSRGSTCEDVTNDENISSDKEIEMYTTQNKERKPLGITRIDSVLQTVNEEKSLSLSTDDSSTLSSAATIIQAHVRGFLLRNKINASKTLSTNSLVSSDSHPVTSSDDGGRHQKNKTVLNIHIVPEAENKSFSRDETVITSVDLSLDGSPPTSINLHPLGYNKSEPRKQLKREDAFQSVSPPSNNSGKLSEDIDSVKEIVTNDNVLEKYLVGNVLAIEENNIKHDVLQSNDSLVVLTSSVKEIVTNDNVPEKPLVGNVLAIEENNIKHDASESNDSLVVLMSSVKEILTNDNVPEISLVGNVLAIEENNIKHDASESNDSLVVLTSSVKEIITNDNVSEKSLVGNVLAIEENNIKHDASESNDSLVVLTSSVKEIVTNDNVPEKSLVGNVLAIEENNIKHDASESNDSLVVLTSSVKEIVTNDNVPEKSLVGNVLAMEENNIKHDASESNDSLVVLTSNNKQQKDTEKENNYLTKMSSDELDVVTPFVEQKSDDNVSNVECTHKLVHSGEFHDVVVPTKVTRNDTSVVRGE